MSWNNGAEGDWIPKWILGALKALKPPERLTVSEWADKNRVLDAKSSNEPGLWRTSRTPYLRGILDAFTDPEVEEIVFVKPTQVGGTECLLNIIGYIAAQDPSPTLVIYPTDTLAEHVSKNRLGPMIQLSPALKNRMRERESKLLELQFDGMFLALSGANSPSQLASRPIRFLLLDEVDKYPPRAGKEGDTIELARERTKTFAYNKKIVLTSTPTHTGGAIWQAYLGCETQYRFYVPCPHCGEYQTLRFRQLRYDKVPDQASLRANTAKYHCSYCDGIIADSEKAELLQHGQWRIERSGSRQKVGFHLNALYSPWITFREVALKWLQSEGNLETRMNFINSWLAEPWEQVGLTADSEKILSRQSRYTQGMVPAGTILLTGGVDKQHDCLYYTVRAWGKNRISWNVDHGRVKTMEEIYVVFDQPYYDEHGGAYLTQLALMDSGDDTGEVYDFCFLHRGLFVPVKGSSNAINGRFNVSIIDRTDSIANGMQLIICDGAYYKDTIFNLLNREQDSWYVFDGCDEEYASQMTAEHKVMELIAGRKVWKWKPKQSGIDNHYLDCEVYCACAADVLGGFELLYREEGDAPPPHTHERNEEWSESGGDWL